MACRTFSTAEVSTLFGISADSVVIISQTGTIWIRTRETVACLTP